MLMADSTYMQRKINSDGVAPVKVSQEEINLRNSMQGLFSIPAIRQDNPIIGRIDRRTDRELPDVSFMSPGEIDEKRYEIQSGLNRILRGIGNMGVVAGTTFLDTVLGGTWAFLSGKYGVNNEVSNYFEGLQRKGTRNIYRPRNYDDRGVMGQMASTVFWGDLIQNMGFTAGMAPITAAAALIPGVGPVAASVIGGVLGATGEARIEGMQTRDELLRERLPYLNQEYQARLASAVTPEERKNVVQWYSQKYNEAVSDADTAGNVTIGLNTALLSLTNVLGWGRMLRRGASFSKKAAANTLRKRGYSLYNNQGHRLSEEELKAVTSEALKDLSVRTRGKTASALIGAGKNIGEAFSEGSEEVAQGIISGYATRLPSVYDYSITGDNLEERETIDTKAKAFGEAWREAFNDKSTWTEFLMGSLTSILGVPMVTAGRNSAGKIRPTISWGGGMREYFDEMRKNARERDIAERINTKMQSGNVPEVFRKASRSQAFLDRSFVSSIIGDDFSYKNNDLAESLSVIELFDEIGHPEILDSIIAEAGNIDEKAAKELLDSYVTEDGENLITDLTGDEGIRDVMDRVRKNAEELAAIKKNYLADKQSIEAAGVNMTDKVRSAYLYGLAALRDLRGRQESIHKELGKYILEDPSTISGKNMIDLMEKGLKNDLLLSPDVREQELSKLRDLRKIEESIDRISKELQKIWDNPVNADYEMSMKQAETYYSNRIDSLRKNNQDMAEALAAPGNVPYQTVVDAMMSNDRDTQEALAMFLDDMRTSEDETVRNRIQNIDSFMSKLRDIADLQYRNPYFGLETIPGMIGDILKDNPTINVDDLENVLYDRIKENILSTEDGDKKWAAFETERNKLKKVRSALRTKASESSPSSEDNGKEVGYDPNYVTNDERLDRMNMDQLIEEARTKKADLNDFIDFEAGDVQAVTWEDLDEYNLREFLKAYMGSKLDEEHRYVPTSGKKPSSGSSTPSPSPLPSEDDVFDDMPMDSFEDSKSSGNTESGVVFHPNTSNSSAKDALDVQEGQENEPDRANEDAWSIGRTSSLYDIDDLKNKKTAGRKKDTIASELMEKRDKNGRTTEQWMNNGKLQDWIEERKKNNLPLTVGLMTIPYVEKRNEHPLVYAFIYDKEGPIIGYDMYNQPHRIRIIGAVDGTHNKESKENINQFKTYARQYLDEVIKDRGNVVLMKHGEEQEKGFAVQILPQETELLHVYSGRAMRFNNRYPRTSSKQVEYRSLKQVMRSSGVHHSKIKFTFYDNNYEPHYIGETEGMEMPVNSHIMEKLPGILWMMVREADGKAYHKYVKVRNFSTEWLETHDEKDAPILKYIRRTVEDIVKGIGNIDAQKMALHTLRNYLYIPDARKLYIIPKKDVMQIGGEEISLVNPNAVDNIISALARQNYLFNIGKGTMTVEQVVNSDILETDLADLHNLGHSFLVKQLVADEESPYGFRTVDSQDVDLIDVHTGKKGFQKSRMLRHAYIGDKDYVRTDEGEYYDYSDMNTPITDLLTTTLIDLFLRIKARKAETSMWFRNKKHGVYRLFLDNHYYYALDEGVNADVPMRLLTDEEIKELNSTMAKKKTDESKKKEEIKIQIGNQWIPARLFGRSYFRAVSEGRVMEYIHNDGSMTVDRNPGEIAVLNTSSGIRIVPNILKRKSGDIPGVLSSLTSDTDGFYHKFFEFVNEFEKGKIPYIESPATASIKDDKLQLEDKGKIRWMTVEEIENMHENIEESTIMDDSNNAGRTITGQPPVPVKSPEKSSTGKGILPGMEDLPAVSPVASAVTPYISAMLIKDPNLRSLSVFSNAGSQRLSAVIDKAIENYNIRETLETTYEKEGAAKAADVFMNIVKCK